MKHMFNTKYKNLALFIFLIFAISISSCTTQKHGYRPAKRKKKDCDCSRWSYNPTSAIVFTLAFNDLLVGEPNNC
jgi:hypothetical protein